MLKQCFGSVWCICNRLWGCAGGINFDAKLRRESTAVEDLFYGHISGMDALARGLRNAAKLLEVRSTVPRKEYTTLCVVHCV